MLSHHSYYIDVQTEKKILAMSTNIILHFENKAHFKLTLKINFLIFYFNFNTYFQEHSTHIWQFSINWCTTKYISRTEWQWNMLYHIG